MQETQNRLKPNRKIRFWVISLLVLIIISALIFVFRDRDPDYETEIVQRGTVTEIVSGTGAVTTTDEAVLSFEASGLISAINARESDTVRSGTVLARLNSTELESQIEEAISNLRREEARRNAVVGDFNGQNKLENAQEILVNTLRKTYVVADDVIRNAVDPFFKNPDVRFSDFDSSLVNYFTRMDLAEQKHLINNHMKWWESELEQLNFEIVTAITAEQYINNLKPIEKILTTIASGVGDFSPTALRSQAQIDTYLSGISQARLRVASLVLEINNAVENVRQIQSESPVFDATIQGLLANIERLQSRRSSFVITAPFNGIIRSVNASVGEAVGLGTSIFTIGSEGENNVVLYVPEVDIANLEIGDRASINFNAFPDEYFEATVGYVATAAQNRDGVTVFKTELYFVEPDPRIRIGMSAEVDIYTLERKGVISIPGRAVVRFDGKSFVRALVNNEVVEVVVETGLRGSDGRVEIISGLSDGNEIITFNR